MQVSAGDTWCPYTRGDRHPRVRMSPLVWGKHGESNFCNMSLTCMPWKMFLEKNNILPATRKPFRVGIVLNSYFSFLLILLTQELWKNSSKRWFCSLNFANQDPEHFLVFAIILFYPPPPTAAISWWAEKVTPPTLKGGDPCNNFFYNYSLCSFYFP